MITDVTLVKAISDANPIQFWAPSATTFNDKAIALIEPKPFYQKWKFDETKYVREDVYFDSAKYIDWDGGVTYSINDLVFDPVTRLRWKSKVNGNINHSPKTDYSFTYWQADPSFGTTPVFNPATVYNNGDRVLGYTGTEGFTNPDFNGNLTGWDGNFPHPGSSSLEQWAYDGVSGGAKTTVSINFISTRGLKQNINFADGNYKIRVKGSIVCSSYPSNVVIMVSFYTGGGLFIADHQIASLPANGSFDASLTVNHAGVGYAYAHVEQAGGASVIASATLIIDLFSCEGNLAFKCFQSLIDANVGHDPESFLGVDWDLVSESNGRFKLKILTGEFPADYSDVVTYSIGNKVKFGFDIYTSLQNANTDNTPNEPGSTWWSLTVSRSVDFDNVRPGSTHQAVNFLWSDFPDIEDQLVMAVIVSEDDPNTMVAKTDCLAIGWDIDNEPYQTIEYTNSDDYVAINYELVNPSFFIPVMAHFYDEIYPTSVEDQNLSNGVIVSLRKETATKRTLNIIDYLPNYMWKKLRYILDHDSLTIDGLPWKVQDDFNRTIPETSLVSQGQILLTQQNSVVVNITKYDVYSGGNVFNYVYSDVFS